MTRRAAKGEPARLSAASDRWIAAVAALFFATILLAFGPSLAGSGSFGGSDFLVNFDPWRSSVDSDAHRTTAPVSDVVNARIPRLEQWGQGVRDGDIELWNPYLAGGTGQHVDAFAPTELPYAALPAGRASAWSALLGVIAAAGGMWLLLRTVGLSRFAGLAGAIIYTFSGFQVAWTLWPQSHVGAVVPFVFWAMERHIRRPSPTSVATLAACVGWIMVEGFPAVAVVAVALAGAYGLIRVVASSPELRYRLQSIGSAFGGVVLGLALAGVALVPLAETLDRASLDRDGFAGFNSEPLEAITLVSPSVLGDPDASHLGPLNAIESASFVGTGAVILLVWGLARRRRIGPPGFALFTSIAVVTLTALVFFDGPHVELAARLPVLDFNPLTRLRGLLGFVVAVGAAIGLQAVVEGLRPSPRRALAAISVAALIALLVLVDLKDLHDSTHAISWRLVFTRPLLVGMVVVVGMIGASKLPRVRGLALAIVVGVLVIDGAHFAADWWRTTDDAAFFPETAAHQVLDDRLGSDRFAGTGTSLLPGTGTYYGHREPTGNAGHPEPWSELLRAADPGVFVTPVSTSLGSSEATLASPILDRLGVRYMSYPDGTLPGPETSPPPAGGQITVAADAAVIGHWPDPTAGALVFEVVEPFQTTDQQARISVDALDADDQVMGSGQRRIHGTLPPGRFVVPVGVPAAATPVSYRFHLDVEDGSTLELAALVASDRATAGHIERPPHTEVVLADGVTLVERSTALSRIRWAGQADVITEPEDRVAALVAGVAPDTVILSGPGPEPGGGSADLEVTEDGAERIVVSVDADTAGYLVVADPIEGSWTAELDGNPAELITADHAVVAVFVDAGNHVVELRHDRGPFHTGLALTLAALVIVVALLAAGSDRRRLLRVAALGLGVISVIVITAVGWNSLEPRPDQLEVSPLLALCGLVLVSYLVVGLEFHLAGRALGLRIDSPTALITTTIATAANLLPIPGAVITRTIVLRRGGATTGAAVRVLALIGGLWLGVSFVAAGFGLMGTRGWISAGFVAVGLGGLAVSSTLLSRQGASSRTVTGLLAAETTMIGLGALRLWLALEGLGISADLGEVVSVGVAAPLSAAVGFVPAGLGVREAIAVALGALSGLGGAEAGVAAALDRSLGLAVLGPTVGIALLLRRRGIGT